jgi:hypothetical protein
MKKFIFLIVLLIPFLVYGQKKTRRINNSVKLDTITFSFDNSKLWTAPEPFLGIPAANGYVLSSTTSGVRSWIPISGGSSVWGSITGTLANQIDLVAEFQKYMKKYGGQVLQDTLTRSGLYEGFQALSGGLAREDFTTLSIGPWASWGGFQLQAEVHYDKFWIRNNMEGLGWNPWHRVATLDTVDKHIIDKIAAQNAVSYGVNNAQSNFTISSYYVYSYGKVVSLSVRFSFSGSVSPTIYLHAFDLSSSDIYPVLQVYGGGTPEDANIKENLPLYINTSGQVWVRTPASPETYLINITFIK